MNSDALTLAKYHQTTGTALSGLEPSRINLLATDPDVAAQYSELSKQAQNFLLTAPPYWWANHPNQHPTVTGIPWSFGSGTTTGTSSLTQLQQNLGLTGQNGAAAQPTSVVQPIPTGTGSVPDFTSGMNEVIGLTRIKTPESFQAAEGKYNLLLQSHPNMYHKSFDSYLQSSGLQRPTAGVDPRAGTVAGTGKDFVPIVQEKPYTAEGGGQYATAEEARTASLGYRTIDKKTDVVLIGIKDLLMVGQPEEAARKRDAAISELENHLTFLQGGPKGGTWTPELIASETQLVNSGLERLRGAIPENLRMQKMRQAMGNKLSAENMKWMSGNISYIENLLKSGTENDIWKAHEYWNSTANLGPDIWNQVQSLNLFPELHTFNTQAEYMASSATGGIKTLKSVSDPVVETAAAVETIPVSAVDADVTLPSTLPSETPAIDKVLAETTPAVDTTPVETATAVETAPVGINQLITDLGGSLDQIDALIAAGNMVQAKAAYTRLLEQNPRLNTIGIGVGELDTPLYTENAFSLEGIVGKADRDKYGFPAEGAGSGFDIGKAGLDEGFQNVGEGITVVPEGVVATNVLPTSLTERQEESGIEASTEVFDKGKRKEGEDPAGPEGRVKTDLTTAAPGINAGQLTAEADTAIDKVTKVIEEEEGKLPFLAKTENGTGNGTGAAGLSPQQTYVDYSTYGLDYLKTLAGEGDQNAINELNARPDSTQFSFGDLERDKTIEDPSAVKKIQENLGLTPGEVIKTTDFYVPPAEDTAVPEAKPSVVTDINYKGETDSYLQGMALLGDPLAKAELENRDFYKTGVEEVIPTEVTAGEAEEVIPAEEEQIELTSTTTGTTEVGLGDDIYNEGGWVIGSLRERDSGLPEVVNAQGKVAGYYDIKTNTLYDEKGNTLRSNVVRKPPVSDFTTLTLDQLDGQQSSPAKEKEWQRRQDLEFLGFDLDDMELMGQLKDITLTEEQQNKMYNDWTYLRDSGDDITTTLPKSYGQQFIAWIKGEGEEPDLTQIMGTTTTETDLVEGEPVAETATTDPVVYDKVTLPERVPFTLPEGLESQLAGTTNGIEVAAEELESQRRQYFDQYEASAILAKSEQDRSALGQLRGQMMARQGLMGSPLGVGLGVQQEAQMRGLAMQEVGRGRAAMEMQLAEQAFRRQETAADRALQAQQFGTTTQLQVAELDLRKQQLEATAKLEEATLAVRQEEFGTTTQLQQASQDLQREQMQITERLNETQQQLETDRSKVAEDLAKAELALQTEQFGAEKGFTQTRQDLEQDKFEAQKKLDKIDRDFRQSELEASLLRADADDRYREKSLGVTTALERMQLRLKERELDVGTEEQRLNRAQREREMEATIGLEEASLALSNRQLDFNKAVEDAKQIFLDRRLEVETGLEVTDQQLREDQFQANLLIEKQTLAYKKHEADATRHLATLELGLKERQLTDTARLQKTNQDLQTAVQRFNESQSRVNNAVTQAELSLRREDLELSRLQLDQAYSNQTAAHDIAKETLDQTGELARQRNNYQAYVAGATIAVAVLPLVLKAFGIGGEETTGTANILAENIDAADLDLIIEGIGGLEKKLEELLKPKARPAQGDGTVPPRDPMLGSLEDQPTDDDRDPMLGSLGGQPTDEGSEGETESQTTDEGSTSVLQTESGSDGELYRVQGTPPATEVALRLRSIMANHHVSIGPAIDLMLDGFAEGYRQSEEEPTQPMKDMMDELGYLRSSYTGALRLKTVYDKFNQYLPGTARLDADTGTTNGTAEGDTEGGVNPDKYQADQGKMVDDLIAMAQSNLDPSLSPYDDNAMITQFNKTDLRKFFGLTRGQKPPFALTDSQLVALNNTVLSTQWFQNALNPNRGGHI